MYAPCRRVRCKRCLCGYLNKIGSLRPCTIRLNDERLSRLYFKSVSKHRGLSRRVILDRDPLLTSVFWHDLMKHLRTQVGIYFLCLILPPSNLCVAPCWASRGGLRGSHARGRARVVPRLESLVGFRDPSEILAYRLPGHLLSRYPTKPKPESAERPKQNPSDIDHKTPKSLKRNPSSAPKTKALEYLSTFGRSRARGQAREGSASLGFGALRDSSMFGP